MQEMFQHSIGRIQVGVNECLTRNSIDSEGISDLSNLSIAWNSLFKDCIPPFSRKVLPTTPWMHSKYMYMCTAQALDNNSHKIIMLSCYC